jgi:hypothetical protein
MLFGSNVKSVTCTKGASSLKIACKNSVFEGIIRTVCVCFGPSYGGSFFGKSVMVLISRWTVNLIRLLKVLRGCTVQLWL